MSEQAPEPTPEENDPDVQEALQEESELLTREMERMKVQHFEQRLIAVNVQNRKLTRQTIEQAEEIESLKQEVEALKKKKRSS